MKSMRGEYDPRRTFAFIIIGAVLVIVVDLFVFDGKSVIWRQDAPKEAPMQEQSMTDIRALQVRHEAYMRDGILPPRAARAPAVAEEQTAQAEVDSVVEPFLPLPIFQVPEEDKPEDMSSIEPASGVVGPEPQYPQSLPVSLPPAYSPEFVQDAPEPMEAKVVTYQPEEPKIAGRGKVAIIIDDMGLTLRSRQVEVMPAPLTLSYLPYAENLRERTKIARQNGHEIMVHVPMEAMGGNDGGPQVLEVSDSQEEIARTVDWALSQFDGFAGMNNHMGSKFTQDRAAMDVFMQQIDGRGLYFVDSKTISTSIAEDVAAAHGIDHAQRDVFLDHEISRAFVDEALAQLEAIAKRRGAAIAIGHPHKETIEALRAWLPTLEARGLELVPVSALVKPGAKRPEADVLLAAQGHKAEEPADLLNAVEPAAP